MTATKPVLEIRDQFTIGLDELRASHGETLRRIFGGLAEFAGPSLSPVSQPAMPGAAAAALASPSDYPDDFSGADTGLATAAPHPTQADSPAIVAGPNSSPESPATATAPMLRSRPGLQPTGRPPHRRLRTAR